MNPIDQAIANINAYIIANANEEITADVLRPLLVELANRVKQVTGNPSLLNTLSNNLVGAINEVLGNINAGHKTINGSDDPNVTEPSGYNLGDYYARYAGTTLINYYQFNGYNWIEII